MGRGRGKGGKERSELLIVRSCSQRQPRISSKVPNQTNVNKHMDPAEATGEPRSGTTPDNVLAPSRIRTVNAQRKNQGGPNGYCTSNTSTRYNHNHTQGYHRLLKNLAIPSPEAASPFCFLFFLGLTVDFEFGRSARSSSDGILDKSCAK